MTPEEQAELAGYKAAYQELAIGVQAVIQAVENVGEPSTPVLLGTLRIILEDAKRRLTPS